MWCRNSKEDQMILCGFKLLHLKKNIIIFFSQWFYADEFGLPCLWSSSRDLKVGALLLQLAVVHVHSVELKHRDKISSRQRKSASEKLKSGSAVSGGAARCNQVASWTRREVKRHWRLYQISYGEPALTRLCDFDWSNSRNNPQLSNTSGTQPTHTHYRVTATLQCVK